MSQPQADRCRLPPAFWRAIQAVGLAPAAILRQARLPASLHINPEAFVSTEQFFALWTAIETLSPSPDIGIQLVEATETSVYPPSMLAAFYARDYRDGLHRIARFKRLCTPEKLNLLEADGECVITNHWLFSAGPAPAVFVDLAFTALLELGRRATGQRIIPRRLELARPAPMRGPREEYFGCPIRYGADRDALTIATSDLDLPFPGHNPELLAILTPALAASLGELQAHSSVGEQVKVMIKRRMASGRPEISDIAHELGVSERTLQRRVTDEGSTFRQLLLEARQELSRHLLGDLTAEIDEIAYLLGYQDAGSFYRAFRDWEGMTPGQWRELKTQQS